MLLRRFTKHITEQNWFAVGLDVLVVITGIFLGMQVTDWNEERKKMLDEGDFLERLYVDHLVTREGLISRMGELEHLIAKLRELDAWIADSDLSKPADHDLNLTLCRWYIAPSTKIQNSTYDELVSTGRLNLISDKKLRMLLQSAHDEHKTTSDDMRAFGESINRKAELLELYREWYILPAKMAEVSPEANNGTACRFDLVALRASDKIRSLISQLYRSKMIILMFRNRQRQAVQNVLDRLDFLK